MIKKIKKLFRDIKIYFIRTPKFHIIIILSIIALSCGLVPFLYMASWSRTVEALRDIVTSLWYYFAALFDKEVEVTVTEFPDTVKILDYLPYDFDEIFRRLKGMWSVVFNAECFKSFLVKIADVIRVLSPIILFGALLVPLVLIVVSSFLYTPNTDHGGRTKAFKLYEDKILPFLKRAFLYFKAFCNTLCDNKWFLYPLVAV